jgi:hypothetical protein
MEDDDKELSHGICSACAKEVLREFKLTKECNEGVGKNEQRDKRIARKSK